MESLTFDALRTAAAVILLLFGAIVTIGKGVDVLRSLSRKSREKQSETEKKLSAGTARLDAHEKSITDLKEGQRCLCEGVQALLEHELHNGNSDEMKRASDGIKAWLVGR